MLGILKTHPELRPYESDLKLRMDLYRAKKRQLQIVRVSPPEGRLGVPGMGAGGGSGVFDGGFQ